MADTFDFQIVTPQQAAFAGQVSEANLPGTEGALGILPGHRPLVTLIKPGTVLVRMGGTVRQFAVGSGFAEVGDGRVTLLTGFCEGAEDIDANAARAALAEYEKRDGKSFENETELAAHIEEIGRVRARVALVERATGK